MFNSAALKAALENSRAAPRSLSAPRRTVPIEAASSRPSINSKISRQAARVSRGTFVAFSAASRRASFRDAISASLSFGSLMADMKLSKTAMSAASRARKRSPNFLALSPVPSRRAWPGSSSPSSESEAPIFCKEIPVTILTREVASRPPLAAAAPPPGVGVAAARDSAKSSPVSISFVIWNLLFLALKIHRQGPAYKAACPHRPAESSRSSSILSAGS